MKALVMGSHKFGDADRVVSFFTDELGRVPVVVKGVRKVKSHFGGRLEPLTLLAVRLHEGRNLYTLTAADTMATGAASRDYREGLQAGLSFIELLARTTTEHERRPRTWNLVTRFLPQLADYSRQEAADSAVALTLAAQLKLLLLAGFLPHLSDCAACGANDSGLPRFSAAAGGSLCPDCPGESFPINHGALVATRQLLEQSLAQAAAVDGVTRHKKEIWQAVREICRHHLGSNLKVTPWV